MDLRLSVIQCFWGFWVAGGGIVSDPREGLAKPSDGGASYVLVTEYGCVRRAVTCKEGSDA